MLALTASCGGQGSPAAGATASGTSITVAAVPGIDNATLALAQQDGLFRQAGLNVRITRYDTVISELTALRAGTAQIAAGDYADLFAAQAISPIYKIVADGYDATPGVLELMTLPGSKITNPVQLAGQHIAVSTSERLNVLKGTPDSLAVTAATSVLQSFSVNLTAVSWDAMSPADEIRALKSGRAQAALLAEPYIYLAQRELGAVELVDACSGSTAGLPLSGYFTTGSFASKYPAAVRAFRTAIEQAAAQAAMPGPIQAVLPHYAGLTRQEASLVTVGNYPTTTIAASLQRTADMLDFFGVTRTRLNAAAMIVR
jgi:NitT/TauT family transport system substrate-binding protein